MAIADCRDNEACAAAPKGEEENESERGGVGSHATSGGNNIAFVWVYCCATAPKGEIVGQAQAFRKEACPPTVSNLVEANLV